METIPFDSTHTCTHTHLTYTLTYTHPPPPAGVVCTSNVANNDAQASRGLFNLLQDQRFKMYAGT